MYQLSAHHAKRWHNSVTVEDRLLVRIRCMRKAGFATLGDFLGALFTDEYNTQASVYQTIYAFLNSRCPAGTHPVDIIEQIFSHPKAQLWHNGKSVPPTYPSLPRHTIAPSQRGLSC
ncbi:hypothetical protein BKA93DRAFT_775811 [Sparassis latifolia]